ncbi:hypothetical protein cce_1420 [Crocosphaera subtropica ATCC 51142]|uniref:Uncharacterized protein n=1 Tax=Crocosphaera subtropica (strain ATCC 51142 / BH68) TaxID=43989 RepID=B1WWP6_CROS5|nr:hypothetical protein [Crocosphaera subtropica]ACB50770.1 hypothetical protein cce_1420 [Crocosphaera subtropica ATCC 51142]
MTLQPEIMKSVEQLGYRVTVGDVAAKSGLNINLAQQGLLALASDVSGHLQVAESGDIIYLFPENFRTILRNKYWKLQLKETWDKIWKVLFYIIRISFGIILIASIILMLIAITVIIIGISSSRDGENNSSSGGRSYRGGGFFFFPNFGDLFWIFYPDYGYRRYGSSRRHQTRDSNEMNFLEAIFSFLFGDGDPNYNLEERRWKTIGNVIRNNKGSIIAEQVAPYLDNIDRYNQENEDYILPVLTRFNGTPEVSPQGELIYYFPELQVTVQESSQKSIASYLREKLYKFSEASSSQVMLAIGLGAINFILALVLGSFLRDPSLVAQFGGFIAFINSIYWLLLGYAIAFLGIPTIRYFVIQARNSKIEERNSKRQERTKLLQDKDETIQHKLEYASQFANQAILQQSDITYTTEKDILQQEIEQADKIDQEWQKRLESLDDN